MKKKPDAAERIAAHVSFAMQCHSASTARMVKADVRRAINAATKAEQQRCVGIVNAKRTVNIGNQATVMCDDIIRDITTPTRRRRK